MQTKTWQVRLTAADPRHPAIQEAAACVRQGELVAFPTETVYGLGADARSTEAVERIFRAKGRPQDNPLIVHISYPRQLEQLAEIDHHVVSVLAERFGRAP